MTLSPQSALSHICHFIGMRVPEWTQGPGSNVSVKEGDRLWIKASGYRLDAVTEIGGIACVRFRELGGEPTEEKYADALAASAERGGFLGRPSMETGFHAALGKKWVAHFHSVAALLLFHEYLTNPKKILDWLRENSSEAFAFIESCRPGLLLSNRIAQMPQHSVYVLQNHGVILQGENDFEEQLVKWSELEVRFLKAFDYRLESPTNTAIPFRIYYPDTAVFYDRLMRVLETTDSEKMRLKSDAWTIDRDACELWQATEILYRACPELSELPVEISSLVANLPTEKFRRALGEAR